MWLSSCGEVETRAFLSGVPTGCTSYGYQRSFIISQSSIVNSKDICIIRKKMSNAPNAKCAVPRKYHALKAAHTRQWQCAHAHIPRWYVAGGIGMVPPKYKTKLKMPVSSVKSVKYAECQVRGPAQILRTQSGAHAPMAMRARAHIPRWCVAGGIGMVPPNYKKTKNKKQVCPPWGLNPVPLIDKPPC